MDTSELNQFKVYDPKEDGIDFKTYQDAFCKIQLINPKLAEILHEGLVEEVLNSNVGGYRTLNDALYGENKYFSSNPDVYSVLFMDGRFHSQYDKNNHDELNLKRLGEEANSIPFMFTREERIVSPEDLFLLIAL